MAETIATDLANGQIAMVATARYQYEHDAVMTNLVTRMELGEGNKSQYIPKFSALGDAEALTDGVDMAQSEQIRITGTTHTTSEVGKKVIITKKLRNQLKEDAYRAAGRLVGASMGRKIDKDLLALLDGLSNSIGGAGTTLTTGHIAAAVAQLQGASEPTPPPYACVIHPYTVRDVVKDIATPGTSHMPDAYQLSMLKDYWRGGEKLYGVPVFGDGNLAVDSGDDAKGGVFSKMAFIYLVGWEPENWITYDDSLRGWEIGIVADYGAVEEDDAYGREMYFDALKPTA